MILLNFKLARIILNNYKNMLNFNGELDEINLSKQFNITLNSYEGQLIYY